MKGSKHAQYHPRLLFCPHTVSAEHYTSLLQQLAQYDCHWRIDASDSIGYVERGNSIQSVDIDKLIGDPQSISTYWAALSGYLTRPGFLFLELEWSVDGKKYHVRMLQRWRREDRYRMMTLTVDENAFLHQVIHWVPTPDNHVLFERYKALIIACIVALKPAIGVIDYEADLICGEQEYNGSLVSWGNYFPHLLLDQWQEHERTELRQRVNEYIPIDDLGVLTFIHPLAVNQVWTTHHRRIDAVVRRYYDAIFGDCCSMIAVGCKGASYKHRRSRWSITKPYAMRRFSRFESF